MDDTEFRWLDLCCVPERLTEMLELVTFPLWSEAIMTPSFKSVNTFDPNNL